MYRFQTDRYRDMNKPKKAPVENLKEVKALSFAINILKTENLIKWGSLVGLNPYYIELDKETSMDIDDIYDFNLCESIYMNNQKKFI